MKISISLPDDDVLFLDAYAKSQGISSRSAVMHRAVVALKTSHLGNDYADAWQQWADSDGKIWDAMLSDGESE